MAKALKELDTSIELTFKDGSKQSYSTIEEASKESGISISALKIRANKGTPNKKDGIAAKWINDHTARHFRAKKSKNKGSSLEYEIVEHLKNIGYSGVCRAAGESKKLDNQKVDIADTNHELEVAIQAKHYQNFPQFFDIQDACADPRDFVMIWKKSAQGSEKSRGTVAVMDVEFFYRLLKCYHNNK